MINKVLSERNTGADQKNYFPISNNNWNFESNVSASFSLHHDERHIYLGFVVEEYYVKGSHRHYNEPVHEDSCVEFFVSFDKTNYYNLEFNCIGNIYGAYGSGRLNRKKLNEAILKNIRTSPSLGFNKIDIIGRKTNWTLDIEIPIETFVNENIDSLLGVKVSGNFYKCGDKLIQPHFLSWSPIISEHPDFHLPGHFGTIEFV